MPAATSKRDLVAVTEAEWARLGATIAAIPEAVAVQADDDGDSPRSVLAHRAHWIDLFLGWWREGQAGRPVEMPAPGYKWSELNRYNRELRARQADIGWTEAQALLADRHETLLAFIDGLDDDALYGAPMAGAKNAWTTGRYAEAAGPSHYRSANRYLRACLRALRA